VISGEGGDRASMIEMKIEIEIDESVGVDIQPKVPYNFRVWLL